ncbi:hypothetical protein M407DRAFT_22470 [Tulasnella calospora MUT 4182]|uniref:Retrotransposon gag domain-containing protein n=1 Tax=Tulasnella calospora MUT 4182 TaxID=1051891 RepID=A0A0C3QL54_9AGAM|nr:hypothetical protein M407DRAFT_22470 [Tulasnella calospora MUT 4182]
MASPTSLYPDLSICPLPDSDQLQFRGKDATECKSFIAALLKLAFARGKQRDDQWMAEFAATCMADDALVWWGELDEEVQGSWKLLRQAMRSEYRPMFYGGSGEEAEKFIRAVRDKAVEEGKRKDNEWIVTYVESCLAGEALRWHAHLNSDTQENWKKLQQALLIQYPRDGADGPALNLLPTPPAAASLALALKVTRRGRIRVSNSSCSTQHYMSKRLPSHNRICATRSLADALEVEWTTGSDGVQTLSIPGSQIPGYDLLGIKWNRDDPQLQDSVLRRQLPEPFDPHIFAFRKSTDKELENFTQGRT